MTNKTELLKLLEATYQRIQHHHDALWEEAKHYSWWIYILLAGLISLHLNLRFLEPWVGILLVVLGNLFGCVLSLIGFNAVRREGEMFYTARQMRDHIMVALKLDQPIPNPSGSGFITIVPQEEFVDQPANLPPLKLAPNACGAFFNALKKKPNNEANKNRKKSFGIRDGFQLTFLITACLFIVLLVVSLITLIQAQ